MRILKISIVNTFFVGIMVMTILLFCSSQVQAAQDGDFTYTISDGIAQITGYTGAGGSVEVPSTLGGALVTSIGDSAFRDCENLTSISIPQGVTGIGINAFLNCSRLTSVSLPQGLESIGDSAFSQCSRLNSISIPQALTSIGVAAFNYTDLTGIYIPREVTSIGYRAFANCQKLTNISVSVDNSNYKSIEGVLFNKLGSILMACPGSITNISIPQGVTCIDNMAFEGCAGLTSINIPQEVTSIGRRAFGNCAGLTSINIPQEVTSICDEVFVSCTSLTSISIPQGVTSIGRMVFANCPSLISISIPPGVTSIGDQAFWCCTSLTSISIPQGVTSISYKTFYNCLGLTSITFNSATTTINDSKDTMPDTTTIIGYDPSTAKTYATKYNRKFELLGGPDLQSIAITTPANKLRYSIGDKLVITGMVVTGNYIDGSTKVERITTANITGFNSSSPATDQVLTIKVGTKTTTYKVQILNEVESGDYTYTVIDGKAEITKYNGAGGNVTIPGILDGFPVTSIGNSVFLYTPLKSISLPQGITSIGNASFEMCDGLKAINLPQSLTNIGEDAFLGCIGLKSINIPQGVISIGTGAFNGCEGLTTINLPKYLPNIGDHTFSGCNFSTINLPQGVTYIGESAFWGCKSLKAINIPQGVVTIGDNAFTYCPALKSISIPQGVTSIGNGVFFKCTGLSTIILPQGLISIGENAFYECAGFTAIRLPQSLTTIGSEAFRSCKGLKSISLPQDVINIGNYTFDGCNGLTTITFNSATTTIHDSERTISATTTIVGYDPSPAKDYATKYNRKFEVIGSSDVVITGLTLKAISSSEIDLSWNKFDGAKSYNIYQATSENGTYVKIGGSKTTSFKNAKLKPSTSYWYKIAVVTSSGESDPSDIKTATTLPLVPSGVKAKTVSSTGVTLSWKAIVGSTFNVYRSTSKKDGYERVAEELTSTIFDDTNLLPKTTYWYYVTAVDSNGGESVASTTVKAITKAS